jgi:NAD(P)-dependent dehydrogenase (short-subunit alcohol dehydrogenase family)
MSSSKEKFLSGMKHKTASASAPLTAWPKEDRRVGDTGRGQSRNPFDLTDRVALVTGSGRGIGRAVAERLAMNGAHVVVSDINDEGSKQTKAIIEQAGGSAEVMHFDVTDQKQIDSVLAAVIAKHGRIDILINNAGICLNATALDTTKDIWDRQMRLNLDAVFYCSKAFGTEMVKRGSGAIVNLSSMAAIIDVHPQDHIGYSVSKAGVAHMSKVLGSEWADTGVRVNAIGPGFVATDMPLAAGLEMLEIWKKDIPMNRFLQPYEIANVIAFLASDASSPITGQLIIADGGVTIW